eukprot:COSAG02_NODE_55009_length_293_cov_0.530928_1_plen_46_part_10
MTTLILRFRCGFGMVLLTFARLPSHPRRLGAKMPQEYASLVFQRGS